MNVLSQVMVVGKAGVLQGVYFQTALLSNTVIVLSCTGGELNILWKLITSVQQ